jgi:hypothetical protein
MHDAAVGIANSFRARMASLGAVGCLDRRNEERDTRRIVGYFQASSDVIEVGLWCPTPSPQSLLDRPPSDSVYWKFVCREEDIVTAQNAARITQQLAKRSGGGRS